LKAFNRSHQCNLFAKGNFEMVKKLVVLGFGLGLASTPALAQVDLGSGFSVTGSVVGQTDYMFRNISQTRNRPAAQGNLELSHESGFYVGGFVSNVAFVGTDARQEVDGLAGFRFEFSGLKVDIGGVYYSYPGFTAQPGQYDLAFGEGVMKLSYEIEPVTLLGTAAYSPDFFGSSGTGVWLEGGFDWKTSVFDITLSGRLGHQWIERNNRFGAPDYLAYGIFLQRDIAAGFSVSVGYYGTDISQKECLDLKICDNRFMAGLTWKL
jgi:uncharacterized protein (TIGR02001 family)